MQDETPLPKPVPQNPDEVPDADEDGLEPEGEELTEDEEQEQARAEMGEVCADCGDEFEDANGSPALCADCFATAEDIGEKEHAPLSKYPVVKS